MSMTAETVRQLIAEAVPCERLDVQGDGRHWFAPIVSSACVGKRLIARHQMVYAALGERLQTDEVHALSMKTLTPEEWVQQYTEI